MANLQIVISALNKAGGDLNKLKTDISGVKSSAKDATGATGGFGSSLSSMMGTAALAAGAVAAVGLAIKQVYDSAKEGAALVYAADKFDRLATSVGTTSDVLLGDLKAATGGMISDAELIASASDMMALGLAKSHDEVVRLSTVASGLNMNMNQLVLTLTNQTTMRFDALGVSVDGFDAKVAKLKETGMSASDAFQEAFLQQAEEQIEKVGNAADSAIAPLQQMETAFKNLSDTMKTRMSGSFDNVAEGLTKTANEMIKTEQAGIMLNSVVGQMDMLLQSGVIDRKEYNSFLRQMGVHSNSGAVSLDAVTAAQERLNVITGVTADGVVTYTEAIQMGKAQLDGMAGSSETAAVATVQVADATNNANEAMRAYNESLLFKIASEGLSAEAAYNLAVNMGLVDKNTVNATKQTDVYKKLLDSGAITQAQYNRLIVDLGDQIDALPEGKTIEVETDTTEIKAKLDELEMRQFKPKTLTVNAILNTSAVDNYLPVGQGTHAVGGAVSGGNPYTWQEYGYRGELFVPSQNGYVLSRAEAERALSRALVNGQSGGGTDSQAIASAVASAVTGAMNASKQPAQSVYAGPSAQDIARAVRDAILMAGVM